MEGVLGAEAWVVGLGDNVSKLYLKREDREGVEGTVRTELLPTPTWTEKWSRNAYLGHKLLRRKRELYPGS